MDSGVEHIGLILSPQHRDLFERYFHRNINELIGESNGLIKYDRELADTLMRYGCRVEFITQENPQGFGHAVFCAKDWLGNEPFLLLLGDHLYRSFGQTSCCRQLIRAFHHLRETTLGLIRMPIKHSSKRGCAAGVPISDIPNSYDLTKILEKPDSETARKWLRVQNLNDDQVFCLFGCYAFTPDIFEILAHDIENGQKVAGEFTLTEAIDTLREMTGCYGIEMDGASLDIGNPQDYLNAFSYLYEHNQNLNAKTSLKSR